MKRIAVVAAAIAAAVGTCMVVRAIRDEPAATAPDGGVAGVTRPDPGPVPGPPRPRSGHDADRPASPSGPGSGHDADRPASPSGPSGPAGDGRPDLGQLDAGGLAGRSYVFEDEVRDPGWAADQERELTLRMRKLVDRLAADGAPVDVDGIECRKSLCRISLHARDVAALSKMYGALESPDGLYGLADNVLLDSVETALDGQVKTRVTAVFDRDTP